MITFRQQTKILKTRKFDSELSKFFIQMQYAVSVLYS